MKGKIPLWIKNWLKDRKQRRDTWFIVNAQSSLLGHCVVQYILYIAYVVFFEISHFWWNSHLKSLCDFKKKSRFPLKNFIKKLFSYCNLRLEYSPNCDWGLGFVTCCHELLHNWMSVLTSTGCWGGHIIGSIDLHLWGEGLDFRLCLTVCLTDYCDFSSWPGIFNMRGLDMSYTVQLGTSASGVPCRTAEPYTPPQIF